MSRINVVLLSLFAVVAVSAVASASASALHWYICESVTSGKYNNSLCTGTTAGKWELTKLPEGKLLAITSKGITPFTLGSTAFGITIEITCKTENDTGWIENPSGGGNGIDLSTDEFSACTVPKPEGQECKTEKILAHSKTELQTLENTETKKQEIYDVFTPDPAGEPFVKIKLEGCKAKALNTEFPVGGKTAGLVKNATSTLFFSNTDMDELTFGGEPAKFEGEVLQLTDGNGGIQAL